MLSPVFSQLRKRRQRRKAETSALRVAVGVPLEVLQELADLRPEAALDSLFAVSPAVPSDLKQSYERRGMSWPISGSQADASAEAS